MTQMEMERQIGVWEDQRALKNLMGKYTLSILLERRAEVFWKFWSIRPDVCLGINEGWYLGAESVKGWYQTAAMRTAAESDLMRQLFQDELDRLSEDELYGVGHLDNRPVSAPVIRVAGDGQTAKGMWTSMGCYTAFEPEYGPQSHWNWSVYAVDFIREEKGWKIWHMQYLTEIDARCGTDWSKPDLKLPPARPEFNSLQRERLPEPDLKRVLHEPWSADRLRIQFPPLPESYGHFEDTFSYGYEQEVGP